MYPSPAVLIDPLSLSGSKAFVFAMAKCVHFRDPLSVQERYGLELQEQISIY